MISSISDIGELSYIKLLNLDLDRLQAAESVNAKQDDTGTRFLSVGFRADGQTFTFPAQSTPTLRLSRPDGECFTSDGFIFAGKAFLELTPDMLAVPGIASADVIISKGGSVLSSCGFLVNISRKPVEDEQEE